MKYTRRDFVKTNAVVGTGALMGFNFTVTNVKPALTGGKPVRTASWPSWPKWNPDTDEPRVLEVLRSGVWSRSEVVKAFENIWAKTTGSKRCVTVVNGTNALIASLTQAG
uniref:DegT/DnrJ/EryC1/StrS family aminotransferase n=1 Tax=uncultured Cyclobacterium sp. TaxID=453820 RepID=UPI0030EC399F